MLAATGVLLNVAPVTVVYYRVVYFFFSFLNAGTYGHSVRFLLSLILKNLLVMNYFASSAPNWSILETRALLFPQKISCELQSCNQNTHMVSSVGVRKGQRTCLRLVKKSGKS